MTDLTPSERYASYAADRKYPVLRDFAARGRLVWYDLRSKTCPVLGKAPPLKVRFFSSEAALRLLARLGAIPHTPTITGPICVLDGQIPAARVHELTSLLPGLTQGEGVLESEFDHYEPLH